MSQALILGGLALTAFIALRNKQQKDIQDLKAAQTGADDFEILEPIQPDTGPSLAEQTIVPAAIKPATVRNIITNKKILDKKTGELLPVTTLPVKREIFNNIRTSRKPFLKRPPLKTRTAVLKVTPGRPVVLDTVKSITRAGRRIPRVTKSVIAPAAPSKPSVIRSITRSSPTSKPMVTDLILNPVRRGPARRKFLRSRSRRNAFL